MHAFDPSRVVWRKSSRSGSSGGDCVEVGAWYTSSYSGGEGGSCVEVRPRSDAVAVRDSKDRTGPALVFTPQAWRSFVTAVRAGTHDPA